MRLPKLIVLWSVVLLALATVACSRFQAEREARERARLELEEKSRREAEVANKAITDMNRKLGRKPPPMDLGLPAKQNAGDINPAASKP
jgi:hypothetical protein